MFCPGYGKENVDNAKLCSGGGAKPAVKGREAGGPRKRTGVIAAAVTAGAAALVLLMPLVVSAALPEDPHGESRETMYSASPGGSEAGPLFGPAGCSTGWVQVGGVWYYYDQNHQMVKGQWLTVEGKDYCFDPDGRLYVGTTTPDGCQVDGNGAYVAFRAEYADIVNANRSRKLYLSSGDDEEWPQFIDHGSYYEVTRCGILADSRYDVSVMTGKGVGDTLRLDDTIYRITDIVPWYSGKGEYVGVEYISGEFDDCHALSRPYDRDYYLLSGSSEITKKDTLYSGSVYFSKDCRAEILNADYKTLTVDIRDYLTKDNREVGGQYGLTSYDGIFLWGDFEIGSSGLVISYEEYFMS